ncbi:MAG: glycosyltransferase family 4 protein [Candidatus Rokubacteria bacterium]|nr:glycosyltransferase family 4 protein [Candidatus Rokubacteria bacterium]
MLETLERGLEDRAGRLGTPVVRVLHLITRLDPGGSTTNTLLTVAGLSSPFRSSLIYGATRELPPEARELRGKVEMTEVGELVRHISPLKDLVALVKICRLIRRGRFDIVHTHSSKAGILGRVAARLAGVPHLVHTPHGHVFTGYAGRMLTRLFILLERWAATFTDRIIGLTEQEIRDHLALKIGKPGQFVSIPSGVDIERFGTESLRSRRSGIRASLGVPDDAFLIGSVGRLEPVKGHIHLLEAFVRLAPRFPALSLALVGDGELTAALRSLAQRWGVADRVLFLGWRDDPSVLLHAFDLFVLPSLNEGMGRALVEAMAAGLPIVASRTGGIPDILGDGEAGLLVEAGSAAALVRGIEVLLLDPALRLRLASAGSKRAAGYSVGVMLERIEDLYRGLLDRAEPTR